MTARNPNAARHWGRVPPITPLPPEDVIDGRELTRLTGLSLHAAEREAKLGNFPRPRRLAPSQWAWSRADILAWLARQQETAAAAAT